MPSDLQLEAQRIGEAFAETWTFDGRDLERPSTDQTLRLLIEQSPSPLRARLEAEFFAMGPLQSVIDDHCVREILVNGPDEIWLEKAGQFVQLEDAFLSEVTFKNWVERLSAEAQIKVDLAHPFADGRWRDFRLHVGCAPLTHCSHHVTLRRLSNEQWTLDRLAQLGWASDAEFAVLKRAMEERQNILMIGPTGCGKTTVLSACLGTLPQHERVVVIEDTNELPRPNSSSTKLLTRPMATPTLPEITLTDLVRQSLRMRPSRLVMGEVRGGEAKDLLLALATGHSGSLGTLHASDPRQALLRLEMLVQLGAPQWNVQAIRQLIQLSVNVLVVCGMKNGVRRLEGLYQIAALESFGFLLEPLN